MVTCLCVRIVKQCKTGLTALFTASQSNNFSSFSYNTFIYTLDQINKYAENIEF